LWVISAYLTRKFPEVPLTKFANMPNRMRVTKIVNLL